MTLNKLFKFKSLLVYKLPAEVWNYFFTQGQVGLDKYFP